MEMIAFMLFTSYFLSLLLVTGCCVALCDLHCVFYVPGCVVLISNLCPPVISVRLLGKQSKADPPSSAGAG